MWALAALFPAALPGQATSSLPQVVPPQTPLSVQLTQHAPMKTGKLFEGRLLYPVFVENQLAIPAGALLRGKVIHLDADKSHRIHARLRGDFTPFHIPSVQFDQLRLPDGTVQPIATETAKDGVSILRLSPPPGKKQGSFLARQIAQEKQQLKDTAALFTAPGRGDRLVQFLYRQLPYHPQRIEAGTAWTVELARPLSVQPSKDLTQPANEAAVAKEAPTEQATEWRLHAYLQQTISSANQKPGNTFAALIAEPVFGAGHTMVVPQGSQLVGEITQSKAARSFGRQGKLRFHFRELKFPSGFTQPVEGTLSGIDSNKAANLQIDTEGGIQPQSQNRVLLPLALTLLAGRAFDDDGNAAFNDALASNGFGIVGRIVGIVASSRNVAAAIGIYGAALSIYDLWIARGHDIVFVKNTRIEITTAPARSPLHPSKN